MAHVHSSQEHQSIMDWLNVNMHVHTHTVYYVFGMFELISALIHASTRINSLRWCGFCSSMHIFTHAGAQGVCMLHACTASNATCTCVCVQCCMHAELWRELQSAFMHAACIHSFCVHCTLHARMHTACLLSMHAHCLQTHCMQFLYMQHANTCMRPTHAPSNLQRRILLISFISEEIYKHCLECSLDCTETRPLLIESDVRIRLRKSLLVR